METVVLKARKRTIPGKKASKRIRNEGRVPGIMYGGEKPQMLDFDSIELYKALSGEHGKRVIVKLDIDEGKGEHKTLLKEIQYHPITDKLIHADFKEIDPDTSVKDRLPLIMKGEPVGVKIRGGRLKTHITSLTVEGSPEKMPSEMYVDISGLDIGQSLRVKDIAVPEGVVIKDALERQVVSVGVPKVEVEKKEEGESEEPEAAEKPAEAGESK